jgi:hypothetical protein
VGSRLLYMTEIRYFGFECRVVSIEWARLIDRDQRERALGVEERMNRFLHTLGEIRELPEAA